MCRVDVRVVNTSTVYIHVIHYAYYIDLSHCHETFTTLNSLLKMSCSAFVENLHDIHTNNNYVFEPYTLALMAVLQLVH